MSLERRTGLRRVLVGLVVTGAVVVPLRAGAADLEEVRDRRAQLEEELATTTAEVEEVEAGIHATEQELVELHDTRAELAERLDELDDALAARARSAFIHGGDLGTLELLVGADGPDDAVDRAELLDLLAERDVASIESATAVRARLAQTEDLVAERQERLDRLRERLTASATALDQRLAGAKALEAELQARRDRQRDISDGAQSGTYACLIARPYSYVDSWGAARSGGRSHKGTDVMAPYGAEVYAFTDGTVSRMKSGGLGGIVLYLDGDDGNRFYYAHLSGYADGISPGTRVEAGQLLAYNGDSGNARGGAPHVHFEVHPGGGEAVNPYPWIRPVCP